MSQPNPSLRPITSDPTLEKLAHLRRVSDLWDRAWGIPGTRWRVGLESLVGLLPVGGDVIGMVMSGYILLQAVQLGLPKTVLLRMIFNILLDALAGSVPILGDLFDTTWKANTKNVNLLETHLKSPETTRQADRRFVFLALAALALVLLVLGAIAILVISFLIQILSGR
jgi:hypothetical protein